MSVHQLNPILPDEINSRLGELGLPALNRDKALRLSKISPWPRIQRAIWQARSQQNMRHWLAELFTRAGLLELPVSDAQASNTDMGHAADNNAPEPEYAELPSPDDAMPASGTEPSSSEPPATPSGAATDGHDGKKYPQVKVYGGKGALTIETDQTKRGFPTIVIEAAPLLSRGENGIGGTYDWQNKIRLQLTDHELHAVLAVFMGLLDQKRLANHGPNNNKGLEVYHQPDRGGFYVKVFEGPKACHVPVPGAQGPEITAIFIKQWMAAAPELSGLERLHILKVLAANERSARTGRATQAA